MAAYLLNIIFSKPAAATSATGLFTSDNPNTPTARSKVWYTVSTAWPTGGAPGQGSQLNQSAPVTSWTTITVDKENFSCSLGDDIYVRLVPDSSWGTSPGLQLRFTTVFGRPATSGHSGDTMASPFVLGPGSGAAGQNAPCTLYTTDTASGTGVYQDYTNPGPDGAWIYYLGQPQQNGVGQKGNNQGPDQGRTCIYSFIVGATVILTVNGAQTQYTYGHDPEMGVKG
jgi:hypothetical protein